MSTPESKVDVLAAEAPRPAGAAAWLPFGARLSAAARHAGIGRYAGLLIALVVVAALLAIMDPRFLTANNLGNIVRTQSVVFMLAIGMTLVILTGGLDLSIASITTASGMVLALVVQGGASGAVGVAAGIGAGVAMGLVNGVLIGLVRVPFFVVTLGTLSIFQSIALLTTEGKTISLFSLGSFTGVSEFTNGSVGPVPKVLFLLVVLYAVAALALHYTRTGRAIYAFGSNPAAARLAGINTTKVLILVYAISGLCAGIGAVLLAGRLTAAGPQTDPDLLLMVIAAVLIGGTAFSGGEGGLVGTAVGVLFLGVVENGLSLANVSTFWQGMVSGAILIAAVGLGGIRSRGGRQVWRPGNASTAPDPTDAG